MYNKIAQIVLNSGKTNGVSDVFIAQPDALKENLAGKIFVIGEIDGKKNEGRKVLDFIISDLNNNYYNDEKILLRDKIEGLKIENIFEAALAKTNKNLGEFLVQHKIRINTSTTNITLGVVYENKLHFSSFGKNRALLIYRRGDGYEIINVEASAENLPEKLERNDVVEAHIPVLFSSVISGEIPLNSYFVFASEALPEYLSNREMVSIITKLPPIVAAEQIKNVLAKMNTYVPFLGVIVKNTLDNGGEIMREDLEENLSSNSSISSLNHTEQKTERMLAPAGLISLSKIIKGLQRTLRGFKEKAESKQKSYRHFETELASEQPSLELGKIKKMNTLRPESFSRANKISFKQHGYWFKSGLKKIISSGPKVFSRQSFVNLFVNFKFWIKNLNSKNRLLFLSLIIIFIVFFVSLSLTNYRHKQKLAQDNFNSLVTQIEEKEALIDSHLMYNDEEGARIVLADAQGLIANFPQEKKNQKEIYNNLSEKLKVVENKIQKIVSVSNLEKVKDLTGLNISGLTSAGGKLYGAGVSSIYPLTFDSAWPEELKVEGATNISLAKYDGKDLIYYRDGNKIIKFNIKDSKTSITDIKDYNEADNYSGFNVYANNFYQASRAKNQIYKYSGNNLSTRSDWLKEANDLSTVVDLYIDGSIYTLDTDGSIKKYHLNKKTEYQAPALTPVVSASKILGDSKQLYILDTASKRVTVIAKGDGHLMSQYVFDTLGDLKDFSVDETGKIIFLLSSDGVYKFSF